MSLRKCVKTTNSLCSWIYHLKVFDTQETSHRKCILSPVLLSLDRYVARQPSAASYGNLICTFFFRRTSISPMAFFKCFSLRTLILCSYVLPQTYVYFFLLSGQSLCLSSFYIRLMYPTNVNNNRIVILRFYLVLLSTNRLKFILKTYVI